nr:MAG TPA: Sequestosome-1, Autophagy, PROTEIN BINDING.4A [Caudoviricetes sp.]
MYYYCIIIDSICILIGSIMESMGFDRLMIL